MVVGIARLTLALGQSRSLKEKRQVVRRIVDRVRARFLVAIAEVDDHDLWQKVTLGIAAVGNEQGYVRRVVDEVVKAIEDLYLAPIISCDIQVDTYTDFHTGPFSTAGQATEGGPDPFSRELLAGEHDDDGSDDEDAFESPDAEGVEDAPWATPPRRRS